jgi:hypothetical protein
MLIHLGPNRRQKLGFAALNSSAAFITMKAGLAIGSCASGLRVGSYSAGISRSVSLN